MTRRVFEQKNEQKMLYNQFFFSFSGSQKQNKYKTTTSAFWSLQPVHARGAEIEAERIGPQNGMNGSGAKCERCISQQRWAGFSSAPAPLTCFRSRSLICGHTLRYGWFVAWYSGQNVVLCRRIFPSANGWPPMWANRPLEVSQPGQLSLSSSQGL